MSVDLLLTHAYFLGEDPHEQRIMRPYAPLGILYIAAFLKRQGIDVEVFDTTFRTPAQFRQRLVQVPPRIVGIYANLMTRPSVVRSIAAAREAGAFVVVGGPEPASYAAEYLAAGAHVVVEGEGEMTMGELVPRLLEAGLRGLQTIEGIHFLAAGGTPIATPPRAQVVDLDDLPDPDREAIDIDRYVRVWRDHHGHGSVSLITARGCPYRCSWCSHGVFGFTHRRRSPARVADELGGIVERYRPDMVWYADDVFTIHHRWLDAYAVELDRRALRVPFETISREDRLDEQVVERLAAMGCRRLWIGAESGSQRILDAMHRQTDAERVLEMVALLKRSGIQVGLFIMLGYEGETAEDIAATVEFLKRANPDRYTTTVAYPIRGTAYHEELSGRAIAPHDWANGSDRQIAVRGRRADAYYRSATRWLVGEVDRARLWRTHPRRYDRIARAFLSAGLGRLGMLARRHRRVDDAAARASTG